MRTDDLILRLTADLQPVDHRQVSRVITAAVIISSAAAIAIMFYAIGVRWKFAQPEMFLIMIAKIAFSVAVVAVATILLVKLAHPGGENRASLRLMAAPFILLMLAATIRLLLQPNERWGGILMDNHWLECLIAIPAVAIVPFAAVAWAVRRAAPTDLMRTGAFIGIIAGGVSATAYALHSTEGWLPFVAIWYCSGIAFCAFLGAKLGPHLLRW